MSGQTTRRRSRRSTTFDAAKAAALEATERRGQRRQLDNDLEPSSHAGLAMPAAPGASAVTTIEIGASAEQRAVDYLVSRGYGIVHRNYRCDVGELDIVAVHGATLVFVEVRSRADASHGDAVESVNRRKQRKVTNVAEAYLQLERPAFAEFRFDVVAINGDSEHDIELYEDAWRGGLW
ncbi:MAG TPA: YraN family protein [Kofleriaceae bacterium]|nr:YraN family protein [Kofleriaceae bacterium]